MELSLIRSRLLKKLVLIFALNIVDWVCTAALLRTERFYEANPLMRQFVTAMPAGFFIKCLFPAAVIITVAAALKILDRGELFIADSFISFVMVFYLAIGLNHIVNFLLIMFSII